MPWGATKGLVEDCESNARSAQLVITDLRMPGITGRRRDLEPVLRHLDATLGAGMDAIHARQRLLVLPVLLVLGDWATSALALDFCFRVLGEALHPGVSSPGSPAPCSHRCCSGSSTTCCRSR